MTQTHDLKVKIDPRPMRVFTTTIRSVVAQCGVIGVGVWTESVAMQWLGFLALLVFVLVSAKLSAEKAMTIDEARAELNRLDAL